MLQRLGRNLLTSFKTTRWRGALLVAVVSDALGFGVVLLPPVQWTLDAVTAAVLFGVLGFRWPLLPALAVEVIPGLELSSETEGVDLHILGFYFDIHTSESRTRSLVKVF